MSTAQDWSPASERLASVADALREAPDRTFSVAEAATFLFSASESMASLERTMPHEGQATKRLAELARNLPTAPAPTSGWSLHALADLITVAAHEDADSTTPSPRRTRLGRVLDLGAARDRRATSGLARPHDAGNWPVLVPSVQPRDAQGDPVADDEDDAPRPVDGHVVFHPREARVPWERPVERDVLPLWLRDGATAKAAAAWAVRHSAHVCAFHTLRAPVYWARLAGRSPHGAFRLVRTTARWALDAEGAPVRRALSAAAERTTYDLHAAQTYVRLEEQRRTLVRTRLAVTAAAALAVVLLTWGLVAALSPWQAVMLAAVITATLGLLGRDLSAPVLSRSVDTESVPKLTSDLILTALGALGIAELNKGLRPGMDGVRFPSPITRDGAGWRADVDLPPGVTAGDVAERRDRLASGLRRPLSCVWPESNHEAHTGRLVLWVADRPMNKAKPVPWPLATRGSVNLFHTFPIGVDPRGRPVSTELMFVSCIVGAMPRMGKTFSLRLIVLGAALDARAELHVFDLKGGADWLPLEPIAHAFRIGDEPDDVDYLLADLRALAQDMTRRYKTLRGLPREVCPEGKVSDALANQRNLGLHPVVLVLDECQRAFEHPLHGKEIATLCEDLAKRGPAAGIVPLYATQRPDSSSLPKPIASNAAWRLCFKVAGQVENDMVLGTSAYQAGVRATMFARTDKGVGYLAGEADEPVIVRMAYLDADAADRVVARARTARLAAGRLTGHAAGESPAHEDAREGILDHLLTIWPAGEDRAWCDTLAERLAETYPGAYANWSAENVTAAVKPLGLSTRQIKRQGANRRGLLLSDLTDALAARTRPADASPDQTTATAETPNEGEEPEPRG